MSESKKDKPEAELCDEALNAVSGGAANGTFLCEDCKKWLPLSKQSKNDSKYCSDCYHYNHNEPIEFPRPGNRSDRVRHS